MDSQEETIFVTQKEFQKHKARMNRRVNNVESNADRIEGVVHELQLSQAQTVALLTSIEENTRETKELAKEQSQEQKEMIRKVAEQDIKIAQVENGSHVKEARISSKTKIIVAIAGVVVIVIPYIDKHASTIADWLF
ncbi:hypothetical protein [Listeria booriae]|uniref:Uncharacterized protein n=1 Tax=Listeria booriae TaxID=1552123 RepID=A0A7X1CC10_9LIST|nr:hypothetical protein [Listeria booriae]MBC1491959.1 hypothetical protein [Listeria booriae]MBC1524103.1 hypothetical protein [Listeria booriae]MBC2389085.1 hypothetical protein [Listeria booriae]